MAISVYIRLFFLLYLFYNCLSSFLSSIYSFSKYLGLFIAKVFVGYNRFSKPIPIKGYLWCIPIEHFKWQYPYTTIKERKLRIIYYK